MIGVYEPLRVILSDGAELNGSRLTLGTELESEGRLAFHERCYGSVADDPEQQRGRRDR